MRKEFKIIFCAVFMLVTAVSFAQIPKGSNPNKPDGFGTPPPSPTDREVKRKVNLNPMEDEAKPNDLDCGNQYQVDVTLTQKVDSCEG